MSLCLVASSWRGMNTLVLFLLHRDVGRKVEIVCVIVVSLSSLPSVSAFSDRPAIDRTPGHRWGAEI